MERLRREKVHALVISRRDIGEADRRVLLLTRPYGLISVVAKGVRRIPSRRGGHLEPLTHITAMISGQTGRYYLAAVEPYDDYRALHADPAALEAAHILAQLVRSVFGEGEATPRLFDAFHQAFQALPVLAATKRQVLEVAVALYTLSEAGLLPQMERCQVCSATQPLEAVVLRAIDGGWRCLSCHDSFNGTQQSLPPALLKAVRWLAQYPQRALQLRVDQAAGQQLVGTVRTYIGEVTQTAIGGHI